MSIKTKTESSASKDPQGQGPQKDTLWSQNSDKEEDDEVDFMSDEFLEQCTKNDVRPGLLMKHSDKRKHEQLKKQSTANKHTKIKNKSARQIEEESRQKVLSTEISSDNKGFLLLQKMGYKPGTSIGKHADNLGAIRTPIPIVLKRNRLGLGEKTKDEKKKQKMNEWKEHLEQLSDPAEYRSRIQMNQNNQQILRDFKKAQLCCQTLDLRQNKTEPVEEWFWPEVPKVKLLEPDDKDIETELVQELIENSDEEDQIPITEKFDQLRKYLQDSYYYCIWCGSAYDSTEDFVENCPGETRDDH